MRCGILLVLAIALGLGQTQAQRVMPVATPHDAAPAKERHVEWTTDYAAALARAKRENSLLFLCFTGSDWCIPCANLQRQVISSPEFKAWANQSLVLVEVDFPARKRLPDELKAQNAALKSKFWAFGYPTVIILDAQERYLVYTLGYSGESAAEWIAERKGRIATGLAGYASEDAGKHK